MFIKDAGTSLTEPAGMYVNVALSYNVLSLPSGTVVQTPIPAEDNLAVYSYICEAGDDTTGISDSHSNTWSQVGSVVTSSGGDSILFYGHAASGATLSPNMHLTLTQNQSSTNCTVVVLGAKGAANSPLDPNFGGTGVALASATGASSSGSTVSTVSGTPSTASGIIVANLGVTSPQIRGLSTGYPTMGYSTSEGSTGELWQNNGYGFYVNSSKNSFTFVWTTSGSNVGGWQAVAAAFEAPAATNVPQIFVIQP
jgi:hypothetical protein